MKVFTTGQVAKICKVAPRTVSKWFDSGRLKGYRIPGSQDRRIPREYLIRFLKEHGMPLGDLEDEAMAKVLIVAQDQVLIENLKRELPVERVVPHLDRRQRLRGRHSGRELPPRLHHRRFLDRSARGPADLPESASQQRLRRNDSDRPVAGRRHARRASTVRASTRRSRSRSMPPCWPNDSARSSVPRKNWSKTIHSFPRPSCATARLVF